MATVNYLYRSTRDKAPLEVRLQHLNFIWIAKTKIEVTKDFWINHRKAKSRNIDIRNEQARVNELCSNLENVILNRFKNTIPETLPTNWLKGIVNPNDKTVKQAIPNNLVDYIDYYIDYRKNDKKTISLKKSYKVVQAKLRTMQEGRKTPILIKEVDDTFKNQFVIYCKSKQYGDNTIRKYFGLIKTLCKHAKFIGLETHHQLDKLSLEGVEVPKIYLTFDELTAIENIEQSKLSDELETARDWLIISCFTGQRISDFMRFTAEMVRTENDTKLIEFTQKKTGKEIAIPLHPKVINILNKRNGQFPDAISDQRYNERLKTICELAEITTMVQGSKMIETEGENFRKVIKEYRKCDLVSSHIGRRSFATNHYGTIPTVILRAITGHSSEQMFLIYIGKPNKDIAMEIIKYF